MYKVKYLFGKLREHRRELGNLGTVKWLLFAVRFRTLAFLTKGKIFLRGEGNIKREKDDARLIMKNGRRVFIFATVPYYDIGGGQRSAQLAKTFNRFGYEVFYAYAAESSESKIYTMEIPTVRHLNVLNYKIEDFAEQIRRGDIVILEFPHNAFLPFVDIAKKKGAKLVYENIDNWETSLGDMMFSRAALKEILKKSDVLVGTARPLVEQLKGYLKEYNIKKNILYVPNAVDDMVFDSRKVYDKPKDLVTGKKTFIYYGSLWGEWFDWDLVYGIAKKYPDYSVILIGEEKCVQNKVDVAPENVHFLGVKKQAELPAYLSYSDIALIPFKVDRIGKYVSPLKVFEYIAMGKTVLSTSLPEVVNYPGVLIGDTIKEWNDLLKKNISNNLKDGKKFIATNSWASRCSQILASLKVVDEKKCDAKFYKNLSIVVLNYNNRNCVFDCIDSLIRFNDRYKYDIIVVDNNSTDGTYEELMKKYGGKIKLLRNKKNGCSSGRNLGIANCETDYIMFLDSDQFALNPYWLDVFFEVAMNYNFGAIGWSGGWLKAPKRGMSSIVDDYPYRYVPADVIARKDLEYLATDGMLMKIDIVKKVGCFDEQYDPTCFEDTDLSFAIRDCGLDLLYCPYLGVYHLPHQTTKSGSSEHNKLLRKNERKFIDKWTKRNKKLFF